MDYNKMPKIDLHCHLDGSVRPETLLELGMKKGLHSGDTSLDVIKAAARVPENCTSLVDYLKRFELPLSVMQDRESLIRISREFMEDCQADGLDYVEVRFAPVLHTREELDFEAVMDAVLQGLTDGSATTALPFGLIVCCMRHLSPELSLEHVRRSLPYIGQGVVAADLAGDEANFPPALHQRAFDLARSHDMNITIHAGETGIAENIEKSISLLYAQRIGHGTASRKNPELMCLLKERQITLEMCPTSNLHTKSVPSLNLHPAKEYLDFGLAVTLNTDNRTVSDITSTEEFRRAASALCLTGSDLEKLFINGVQGAFVSPETKEKLLLKRRCFSL